MRYQIILEKSDNTDPCWWNKVWNESDKIMELNTDFISPDSPWYVWDDKAKRKIDKEEYTKIVSGILDKIKERNKWRRLDAN